MHFGIVVLSASETSAEVVLPISGITIAFSCPSRSEVSHSLLVEVSRTQPRGRLDEPIRVSAFALENMRKAAATAIAQKRADTAADMRGRVVPFQLSFNLR